jgi:hypothetical protein
LVLFCIGQRQDVSRAGTRRLNRRASFRLFDANAAVFHLAAVSFEADGRELVREFQFLVVAGADGDFAFGDDFDRAAFRACANCGLLIEPLVVAIRRDG